MLSKKKNPARGRTGARRPGVALASLAGLALATLAVANPVSLDVIKHSPLGVLVESAASLPAEVRALEQQTAAHVFDRGTTTEHTVYVIGGLQDLNLVKPADIWSTLAQTSCSSQPELAG